MKLGLMLALIFAPAAQAAPAAGPHYFTLVRNDAYNCEGGPELMAASYTALEKMVQLADAQNVKLTLLFSAQYADYISTDSARAMALAKWRVTGHEIGAWHQGPDAGGWDGYTGLTAEELEKLRGKKGEAAAPGPADFFAALKRLDQEIRTACIAGEADKAFAAAAPVYEACARAASGRPGVNDHFLPARGGAGARKRLSSSSPSDRGGVEEARKNFLRMKDGVYGAAFESAPSEFGAFYVWLAFLKEQDPGGARSRTVAEAAGQGLIKAQAPGAWKAAGKTRAKPAAEAEGTAVPKLKPVDSPYSQANKLFPSRGRLGGRGPSAAVCGDGICAPQERLPGRRCLPDCGVRDR